MTTVTGTNMIRQGARIQGTITFSDEQGYSHVFTPHAILAVVQRTSKLIQVYVIGGQQLDITVKNAAQAIIEYTKLVGGLT